MATLPPPKTKEFPSDSLEKRVYSIVEKYKEYIPVTNDRNRLGYTLFKFCKGEGDAPAILVKSTKLDIQGITPAELAEKISNDLKEEGLSPE